MPERETLRRARADKRAGKSPSTQAGEFVREEIHHVREGKHGAASTKQAIAIGLSKARKAGVRLPPKGRKRTSSSTTQRRVKPSARRARATLAALKRKPRAAASHRALSRQARTAARRRRKAGSARNRKAAA
jgi:uncharacterized protein DUF6496